MPLLQGNSWLQVCLFSLIPSEDQASSHIRESFYVLSANPNLVMVITKHGGHLAYFEGITARTIWYVILTLFYLRFQTSLGLSIALYTSVICIHVSVEFSIFPRTVSWYWWFLDAGGQGCWQSIWLWWYPALLCTHRRRYKLFICLQYHAFKLWLTNGQKGSLRKAYSGLWRCCPSEKPPWFSRFHFTTWGNLVGLVLTRRHI